MKCLKALFLVLLSLFPVITLNAAPAQPVAVVVSAAASLTDLMNEAKIAFEAEHSGVRIDLNFAATGVLQTQIEQGAPVAVFAGASSDNLAALNKKGLLDEKSMKVLCGNTLTLLLRPGLTLPGAGSFAQVTDPLLKRIAVGDPQYVPAGKYAITLLTKLNLAESVRPKLVYASNVREALTWVGLGEVDAAIVYNTDAITAKGLQVQATTKPGELKIEYGIAVTKIGSKIPGSYQFVAFLTGDQGRKLLKKYGFLTD